MIIVACVLYKPQSAKSAPSWAGCYSPEWVDKLYRGIARWYGSEFHMVCVSDEKYKFSAPIETIPIWKPIHWQQAALQLHAVVGDRIVTMGLDTVIVGPLHDLFAYRGNLLVPRDPYHPKEPCNGVTVGRSDAHLAKMALYGETDMTAIKRVPHEYFDDLFPGRVISYKVGMRDKGLSRPPVSASIIMFHGNPKPHELFGERWVEENWL